MCEGVIDPTGPFFSWRRCEVRENELAPKIHVTPHISEHSGQSHFYLGAFGLNRHWDTSRKVLSTVRGNTGVSRGSEASMPEFKSI